MMEAIKCLLSDQVIFPVLQVSFFLLTAFAWVKERGYFTPTGSAALTVKRGEKSWSYFHLAYALLVVVFVETINTTEALKGYKTAVTVIDLALLLYLCFFNGWFRNKILGIINSSQQRDEK